MTIKDRRDTDVENFKLKIINAAKEVLLEEGYEQFSMRKIAKKINYSPGTIYHYFKDKSEILEIIVEIGYNKILNVMKNIPIDTENPELTIENQFRIYIDLMVEMESEFKIILWGNIENIKDKINILEKGISQRRESMYNLCQIITLGIEKKRFRDIDPELTAQIIWTSTHGLISRLIIEKNISREQKYRLIDHHFKIIINGLLY